MEAQLKDILSLHALNEKLEENLLSFQSSDPFPYLVKDDFLPIDIAKEAVKQFPKVGNEGWIHYVHFNEKKHGLNKVDLLPSIFQQIIATLNSKRFLDYLREVTGIPNLVADEQLEGGGLHQSEKGGFLNIHADFTVHPHKRNWRRRINLLVYFNENWQREFGGELEFWDTQMKGCVKKIEPVFNRCVIFETSENSYHGFPEPIQFPEGDSRKSLALYYFTEEETAPLKRATNYKARPGDGIKRLWIYADKKALVVYSKLKSWLGINDDFISNVLKRFNKK